MKRTKAKVKKRHVLGVGYPIVSFGGGAVFMFNAEGNTLRLKNCNVEEMTPVKYRLILEKL